ncbi:MAG: hypothetical protein J7604_26160, partial [Sporocytophaga sp.]|uniref:hypothetical protein n=1 Tax=Sporocytophaga sp. TaxID=2231183 RepID=UPI001B236EC8
MLNFLVLFDSYKKQSFFFLRIIFASIFFGLYGYCNATGTFTWKNPSTNNKWEDPLNWSFSGATSVPVDVNNRVLFTSSDEVIIVSSNNIPELSSNQTVGIFKVNSGSLRISNGFILNATSSLIIVEGSSILGTEGIINAGTLIAPAAITIGGISFRTVMQPALNIYANSLTFYKTDFSGNITVKLMSGLTLTGGNVYTKLVNFESAGSVIFRIATSSSIGFNETFNNDLNLKVTSTGGFDASYLNTCNYNGNINLENQTSSYGIRFGQGGSTGISELKENKIISAQNFTTGYLWLSRFKQFGATAQDLTLTNGAILMLGVSSEYGGVLKCRAPSIGMQGGTYNDIVDLNITGSGSNYLSGTASFIGTFKFENSGSGACYVSTYSGDNYTFKKASFINSSSGSIWVSQNAGANSTFSDTTIIENKGTPGSIQFSNGGTSQFNGDLKIKSSSAGYINIGSGGLVTLGNNVRIIIPEDSFTIGNLYLFKVIQTDATEQNIKLTGTSVLSFRGGMGSYKGKMTVCAPSIGISGTFMGVCNFTKTGSAQSNGEANTIFEEDVIINNKSAGSFTVGGVNTTFNKNVTFNNDTTGGIVVSSNTGNITNFNGKDKVFKINNRFTGAIYVGLNGICNFKSDILLSNLSTGNIYLGTYTPSIVNLSSDCHINTETFNSGVLSLNNLKQEDSESYPDINLSLSNSRFIIGSSEFKSKLTAVCNSLTYGSSQFHNITSFTCNGNISNGGSVFNTDYTLNNNGTGICYLGSTSGDIYKGDVFFNKNSTGPIYPSNKGISE